MAHVLESEPPAKNKRRGRVITGPGVCTVLIHSAVRLERSQRRAALMMSYVRLGRSLHLLYSRTYYKQVALWHSANPVKAENKLWGPISSFITVQQWNLCSSWFLYVHQMGLAVSLASTLSLAFPVSPNNFCHVWGRIVYPPGHQLSGPWIRKSWFIDSFQP